MPAASVSVHVALPAVRAGRTPTAVQTPRASRSSTGAAPPAGRAVPVTVTRPPGVTVRGEAATAAFARTVMEGIVGAENVTAQEPTMGAEDFSYMLQAVPGAYAFIGNGEGAHREIGHGEGPCTLHNPNYDFNDELIPLGGTFWVKLVEASLIGVRT